MSEWVMKIPSMVFTKIKNDFSQTLKEQYGMTNSNFSTVGSTDAPAVFPFVYLQSMPSVELGADMNGTGINAGLFTFQVDVIDNDSQSNARRVMGEVLRVMKTMRFEMIAFPEFEDTKDTHRCVARFRRVIGANDTL